MPNRFFITGTDTGVGKTTVAALLCAALNAIYWKPIQTGTRQGTDRATIIRLAELPRRRTLPEAYRFSPPVSPHLAARLAGVRIELRKIKLPEVAAHENFIAEGAGGVLVPINSTQLM
ncbi:MAG: ATP-dependent dethiobiotin synthetase BioD, partial [Candidatus Acidiferrales bacterium]